MKLLTTVNLLLLLAPTQVAAASPTVECQRVRTVGDVDGDGVAERIVGDARGTFRGLRTGTASVLDGQSGRAIYSFAGDSKGDRFGWSVAVAGDVDRDGVPDFVVGAPLDDRRGNGSGSVYVFSGRDGSRLYRFSGTAAGQQFGYAVAAAGDVDGDGHADIQVGAPFADVGGRNTGYVRVFSGKDGAVIRTGHGTKPNERRGRELMTDSRV